VAESGVPETRRWLAAARSDARSTRSAPQGVRRKQPTSPRGAESLRDDDPSASLDDDIEDSCCGLMFTVCIRCSRPRRAWRSRCAVGGLTTDEIARAFLVPEATIAQRIVRAEEDAREKRIPFEAPRGPRARRETGVGPRSHLPVFNEGYAATEARTGAPQLCRTRSHGPRLAALLPDEPECTRSSR